MQLTDKIFRPILTEKSLAQARLGRYTFEVSVAANKNQIREALENAFSVKVKKVRTAISKEAVRLIAKSRRQVPGSVWKKATVELSSGKLSLFEISGGEDDKKS